MIVHICTERERAKPSDKCGIILVVLTEYHLQRLKENSKVTGIHNQCAGETKEEMLRAVEQRSTSEIVGEKFSSLKRVSIVRKKNEKNELWRTVANINGRSSMVHMHVNLLLKRWTPSPGKD